MTTSVPATGGLRVVAEPGPRPLLDRRMLRAWPIVGLAIVLGAAAGLLLHLGRSADYFAVAQVDLNPRQPGGSSLSSDQVNRDIQTNLIYLNGPVVAAQVAHAVGTGAVSISARQVGLTELVEVRASAADRARAV